MPPAAAYDAAVFPTPEQLSEAGGMISERWSTTVGAEVTR